MYKHLERSLHSQLRTRLRRAPPSPVKLSPTIARSAHHSPPWFNSNPPTLIKSPRLHGHSVQSSLNWSGQSSRVLGDGWAWFGVVSAVLTLAITVSPTSLSAQDRRQLIKLELVQSNQLSLDGNQDWASEVVQEGEFIGADEARDKGWVVIDGLVYE